jgi:hypothetical protein
VHERNPGIITLLSLLLLVPMIAGCGFMIHDKGSEITFTGMSLVYTDWVVPAERDWHKDTYECERDVMEAAPSYTARLFGRRQVLAERCLTARGYVRR